MIHEEEPLTPIATLDPKKPEEGKALTRKDIKLICFAVGSVLLWAILLFANFSRKSPGTTRTVTHDGYLLIIHTDGGIMRHPECTKEP